MSQHVWARPYHGHLPQKYVDELGKFVDAGPAHEIAYRCLADIVLGGLRAVAIGIAAHGAELVAREFFSMLPAPPLLEKDGAGGGAFDGGTYNKVYKGEEGAEEQAGENKVEGSFQQAVLYLRQGFFADAEHGYAAEHLEMHAAVQVVVHVGHAEEMYQVVFAIVDDGDDFMAVHGGKAAIDLFRRVHLEVSEHLCRLPQVSH